MIVNELEALNGESLIAETQFEQETMKPGEMQGVIHKLQSHDALS